MVASSAYLGFLGLGLEESGFSGRTHLHVVSGGIKCERGLKEHSSLSENDTRKIYYHKTRDANTYNQTKPAPFKESRSMLTGHHSSKLHYLQLLPTM